MDTRVYSIPHTESGRSAHASLAQTASHATKWMRHLQPRAERPPMPTVATWGQSRQAAPISVAPPKPVPAQAVGVKTAAPTTVHSEGEVPATSSSPRAVSGYFGGPRNGLLRSCVGFSVAWMTSVGTLGALLPLLLPKSSFAAAVASSSSLIGFFPLGVFITLLCGYLVVKALKGKLGEACNKAKQQIQESWQKMSHSERGAATGSVGGALIGLAVAGPAGALAGATLGASLGILGGVGIGLWEKIRRTLAQWRGEKPDDSTPIDANFRAAGNILLYGSSICIAGIVIYTACALAGSLAHSSFSLFTDFVSLGSLSPPHTSSTIPQLL